jgi:hypothetical protein
MSIYLGYQMKTQTIKTAILAALLGIFGSAQATFYDFFNGIVGTVAGEMICANQEHALRGSLKKNLASGNYGQAALQYGKSLALGAAALTAASYLDTKDPNFISALSQCTLETIGGIFVLRPLVMTGHDAIEGALNASMNDSPPQPAKTIFHYLASLGIGFSAIHAAKTYTSTLNDTLKNVLHTGARNFIIRPTMQITEQYITRGPLFRFFAPLAITVALIRNGY